MYDPRDLTRIKTEGKEEQRENEPLDNVEEEEVKAEEEVNEEVEEEDDVRDDNEGHERIHVLHAERASLVIAIRLAVDSEDFLEAEKLKPQLHQVHRQLVQSCLCDVCYILMPSARARKFMLVWRQEGTSLCRVRARHNSRYSLAPRTPGCVGEKFAATCLL